MAYSPSSVCMLVVVKEVGVGMGGGVKLYLGEVGLGVVLCTCLHCVHAELETQE